MEGRKGEKHSFHEDVLAMLLGTLFVAFGVVIYSKAVLLIGGMAGMALLVQYLTGTNFWVAFSLINLPFYFLALKRMGWRFTVRTFLAVSLVSLLSRLTELWVGFSRLDPAFAAIIGGGLCGTGMLMLFRHHTGLGGTNILAIFLQEAWSIRAGYFQLAIDLAILGAALFVLTPDNLLLSILGATVVNVIIGMNHKPGRYHGFT
jgi:uncharacterized membrane-anchored protein YitT (DUF2179 family)